MDSLNEGITPSEKFLLSISRKTFLSLWSFPNPFNRKKKELCDLLIVCNNIVIIFSDKEVNFKSIIDVDTSWIRWCKKAIYKSRDQLFGAERYIKQHPDKIYLDSKCKEKIPVEIDVSLLKIYRIVVANGAKRAIEEYFRGNSRGSLILKSTMKADDNLYRTSKNYQVFSVGDINPGGGFIHIFNEENLELILSELDTLSDFINYLESKEKLLRGEVSIEAAGEEELLAYYIKSVLNGKNHFDLPDNANLSDHIVFAEGLWDELQENIDYIFFKKHLEPSYNWDKIIEMFSRVISDGTAYCYDRTFEFVEHERAVRFLALESRINRSFLYENLSKAADIAPINERFARTVIINSTLEKKRIPYIFMFYTNHFMSKEDSRKERLAQLYAYCIVFLGRHKDFGHIVGLAFDNANAHPNTRSEDIVVLINTDRESLIADAIRIQILCEVYKDNYFEHKDILKEFPNFTKEKFDQIVQEANATKLKIENG